MKVQTLEIAWNETKPIYSIDFQPNNDNVPHKLATAGADKDIKLWGISVAPTTNTVSVDFLSNLSRHTGSVNCVRFSPDGNTLASSGDESVIFLWKLRECCLLPPPFTTPDSTEMPKETWVVEKMLRGHLEDIYDLCWSPGGDKLISGSVDNTAIIWNVERAQKLAILKEHKGYVQGVSWNPKGQHIATLSTDRSLRIYNANTYRCLFNHHKFSLTQPSDSAETDPVSSTSSKMFLDDTYRSYFRRLCWSVDGELLFTPAGRVEKETVLNTTYVFTSSNISRPALHLPTPDCPSVAVRCCPIRFSLHGSQCLFDLPYRMVFAVATESSVVIYDTQRPMPIGFVSNIHYTRISDVAWSSDGRMLTVSSSDGYCSFITFDDGELGQKYVPVDDQYPLTSVSDIKEQPLNDISDGMEQSSTGVSGGKEQPSTRVPDGKGQPLTGVSVGKEQPSTRVPYGKEQSSTDAPYDKEQPSTGVTAESKNMTSDLFISKYDEIVTNASQCEVASSGDIITSSTNIVPPTVNNHSNDEDVISADHDSKLSSVEPLLCVTDLDTTDNRPPLSVSPSPVPSTAVFRTPSGGDHKPPSPKRLLTPRRVPLTTITSYTSPSTRSSAEVSQTYSFSSTMSPLPSIPTGLSPAPPAQFTSAMSPVPQHISALSPVTTPFSATVLPHASPMSGLTPPSTASTKGKPRRIQVTTLESYSRPSSAGDLVHSEGCGVTKPTGTKEE